MRAGRRCETATVRIEHWEMFTVPLTMREPFTAVHSRIDAREVLLLHVVTDEAEGWSECGVLPVAGYSTESVESAAALLADTMLARAASSRSLHSEAVSHLFADLDVHREAIAAVEAALIDAECRLRGVSIAAMLAERLDVGPPRGRVEAGVALGLDGSADATAEIAVGWTALGYRRLKVKIVPGHDRDVVAAVRARIGDETALYADANGAYSPGERARLAQLDEFGMQCLEQPYAAPSLAEHADLARSIRTPVCLDESVTSSTSLVAALEIGACSVVNLKWSRVGGIHESLRILEECRRRGAAVWIGGMISSGIGKSFDIALAAQTPVTMIGDITESSRHFARDVTAPFEMTNGMIPVPDGPGIGVEVDVEFIRAAASRRWSGGG